jgi:hypothetical protein
MNEDDFPERPATPPRFEVIATSWGGDARPRYCVVDRETKDYRFPRDPHDREEARDLCRKLAEEAKATMKEPEPEVVARRPCRACGKPLVFVKTASGKLAPMEADEQGQPTAVNHFTTCPRAGEFTRRRRPGATAGATQGGQR